MRFGDLALSLPRSPTPLRRLQVFEVQNRETKKQGQMGSYSPRSIFSGGLRRRRGKSGKDDEEKGQDKGK